MGRAGRHEAQARFKKDAYLGLSRGVLGAEGTLSPQPVARRYDGRPVRFDDAVGIGWTVVGIGIDPREKLGSDVATWDQVDATFATVFAPGSRPQGTVGDLMVLRPDKFVFGASDDATALTGALRRQLGLVDLRVRPAVEAI